MRLRPVIIALAAAAVVLYAFEGGPYGTTDLLRQHTRKRRLQATVDSLQRVVDSLARRKRLVQTDPAAQERIAREEFGMVRGDRELLYRFAEPRSDSDSAVRTR